MTASIASRIDWGTMRHFGPDEWPSEQVLANLSARVVRRLDDLREALGRPVYPSPLSAGWVRFTGSNTSQHYAVNRLSTAGDVFPEGDPREAFLTAVRLGFGGVGAYFDTEFRDRPWPMLHVDLRPGPPVYWCRVEGEYIYHPSARFWQTLGGY